MKAIDALRDPDLRAAILAWARSELSKPCEPEEMTLYEAMYGEPMPETRCAQSDAGTSASEPTSGGAYR